MANIVVQSLDSNNEAFVFRVEVFEDESRSAHKVELDKNEYQTLTDGKVSAEEFVQCAFEFLLDREPKESILSNFNISIISRYFPEFEKEILSYF